MTNSLFDKLLNKKEYQDILKTLPEDEQKALLEAMKKLVEQFETTIINPIKNLNPALQNKTKK